MTRAPEIRPRGLGEDHALARDLIAGRPRAVDLLPKGVLAPDRAEGRTSEARLGPGAFETTTPEARRRLERILDGDGVLVSTGQQPVLFAGPMYVLYKALTAVQLAREVEAETGRPALASFWIASDDHDWEEVGSVRLLDRSNRVREVRLDPPPGRRRRSAGPTPLPEGVTGLVDEIAQLLPESEFVGRYLELLREAYRPGRSLAEAFGHVLSGLLGDRPLAWIDTGRAEVKRASVPLLRRSLEDAAAEEEAFREGAERVREAGYDAQIPVMDGGTHVFYDTGDARVRLYRAGEGELRLGREGARASRDELERELDRAPGRFSPNVSLRPVLESWLLPTAYVVAGPGELAYWTQVAPLFRLRDVAMPALRPRHSWVVLEEKVAKVLRKVDAGVGDFRGGGEELIHRTVSDARPEGVEEALTGLRAAVHQATVDVEEALQEDLPGLQASVGKARSRLFQAVDELDAAVDARVEERQEVVVRQIRKAASHLFPQGRPQERVVNPFYYLARYGDAFLEAVEEAGVDRSVRPWHGTDP